MFTEPDVAVVGGGIAGVDAAAAAASTGATTLLLGDDIPRPGSLPQNVIVLRSSVWACFADLTLAIIEQSRTSTFHPRAVVVATGAHRQPIGNTVSTRADVDGSNATGGILSAEQSPLPAASELAQMAGADVRYHPNDGGWVPVLDTQRMSTVPGLFVAGEAAGPRAPEVAKIEGRLAGLAAAVFSGFGSQSQVDEAQATLHAAAPTRFTRLEQPPNLATGSRGKPFIVCSCEGVDDQAVRSAIARGAVTINAVKRRTRAGMGECQGVLCTRTIADLIHELVRVPIEAIAPMTARPPLRPITLGQLAALDLGSASGTARH